MDRVDGAGSYVAEATGSSHTQGALRQHRNAATVCGNTSAGGAYVVHKAGPVRVVWHHFDVGKAVNPPLWAA